MFDKNVLSRMIIIGNSVFLVFGIQNFESIGVKSKTYIDLSWWQTRLSENPYLVCDWT